jgi:hypothetical protein
MPEMRVPKSEMKKKTEEMKQSPKVKITGSASTPPRVSSSMISSQPRTSAGVAPGTKTVAKLYRPTVKPTVNL